MCTRCVDAEQQREATSGMKMSVLIVSCLSIDLYLIVDDFILFIFLLNDFSLQPPRTSRLPVFAEEFVHPRLAPANAGSQRWKFGVTLKTHFVLLLLLMLS